MVFIAHHPATGSGHNLALDLSSTRVTLGNTGTRRLYNVPNHSDPVVFATFGSTHDAEPSHVRLVGWDANTLQQYSVFNDTPNGYGGSVSGRGAGCPAQR